MILCALSLLIHALLAIDGTIFRAVRHRVLVRLLHGALNVPLRQPVTARGRFAEASATTRRTQHAEAHLHHCIRAQLLDLIGGHAGVGIDREHRFAHATKSAGDPLTHRRNGLWLCHVSYRSLRGRLLLLTLLLSGTGESHAEL